jgi:hypothetical protein
MPVVSSSVSGGGVTIYLSRGRTLAAKRFEEAVSQPHLMGEIPLRFRCDSEIGHLETSIALRSTWTTTLQISVRPTSSIAAQELYGALENWASEIRPPDWQRFWLQAASLFRFILFFWVLVGLPFMYFGIEREAKYVYQPEAKRLLDQGINSGNEQKAIELILTIVSGAGPKNPVLRPGIRGWGYWAAITLVLGVLSFCPKAVIGVWRGKQRLKLWRIWITTVWVTIPLLVVTTVIWPRLLAILGLS